MEYTCKICNEKFERRVSNSSYCDKCKSAKVLCACGCGQKVSLIGKSGMFTGYKRYVYGHGSIGKIPKHKKRLYKYICKYCGQEFEIERKGGNRAFYCNKCQEIIEVSCSCGCGEKTYVKRKDFKGKRYIKGHYFKTNEYRKKAILARDNSYLIKEGRRVGKTNKGRKFPKESYDSRRGRVPWNKGKKGITVPWNKGLTKETDKRLAKSSLSLKKYYKTHGPNFPKMKLYEDTGMKFRSSYENDVAKILLENGIEFEYETKRFKFPDKTYIPDFYLPKQNIVIEVSGFLNEAKMKKIESMKKYYPQINLVHIVGDKRFEILNLIGGKNEKVQEIY